jgi:hypothetical protein
MKTIEEVNEQNILGKQIAELENDWSAEYRLLNMGNDTPIVVQTEKGKLTEQIIALKRESIIARYNRLIQSEHAVDDLFKVLREILQLEGLWHISTIETTTWLKAMLENKKDLPKAFELSRRFLINNRMDDRQLIFAMNKLTLRTIEATTREIRKELEDELLL